MTQNEAQLEAAALAAGLAAALGRRRTLGMRRTAAVAPPAPAPRRRAAAAATVAAPAPRPQPAAPSTAPASGSAAGPTPARPPGAGPAAAPAPAAAAPAAPQRPSTPQPAPSPPQTAGHSTLQELSAAAATCQGCALAQSRTHVIFAAGTGASGVLFLDEAPSPETDASGDFFRGPGGPLLADIITKGMGLPLGDVQVASLVKCLPPDARPPEPGELGACRAWLDRQIELANPKVIVTLGRPAAAGLLGIDAPLGRLRGSVHDLGGGGGRKVVATYHPSYLTRAPEHKKAAWQDIQLAMQVAGIPLRGV